MTPKYTGPDRRSYPADEWMQGLPIWAKILFQVLFIYGPLSAIAIFLVYVGAKNLPEIRMEFSLFKKELEITNKRLEDISSQNREIIDTTRFILFEFCTSSAKDDTDRRNCLDRYRTAAGTTGTTGR